MNIISTLGPSITKNSIMKQMVKAGCDGFRFTAAHTDLVQGANQIEYLRENFGEQVNIILDIQGHKVRVSELSKKNINLNDGEEVGICSEKFYIANKGTTTIAKLIPIDIEFDFNLIKGIDIFSSKDCSVSFNKTRDFEDEVILFKVKGRTILRPRTGINIRELNRSDLGLTIKDKESILWGLQNGIDTLYVSYVVNSNNIKTIKKYIRELVKKNTNFKMPKIYSKIENMEGVNNFIPILKISDGIVLGRGDLHNEIKLSEYPVIQDNIIKRMKKSKKELVLATHILTSLAYKNKPSMPEISDLYNFIKNKVDTIVLVTETSVGKNPRDSVKFARCFIDEVSNSLQTIKKEN